MACPHRRQRQGDSDQKARRREARTCAMKWEVRATGEGSARFSGRPLYKRSRTHLSVSCDKKSDVPWDVPFFALGRAIEMMRASQKSPTPCGKPALARHLENHFQFDRGA